MQSGTIIRFCCFSKRRFVAGARLSRPHPHRPPPQLLLRAIIYGHLRTIRATCSSVPAFRYFFSPTKVDVNAAQSEGHRFHFPKGKHQKKKKVPAHAAAGSLPEGFIMQY